jgi:hypothetical protein
LGDFWTGAARQAGLRGIIEAQECRSLHVPVADIAVGDPSAAFVTTRVRALFSIVHIARWFQ